MNALVEHLRTSGRPIPDLLAEAETWTPADWAALAERAGVHAPSAHTVRYVLSMLSLMTRPPSEMTDDELFGSVQY